MSSSKYTKWVGYSQWRLWKPISVEARKQETLYLKIGTTFRKWLKIKKSPAFFSAIEIVRKSDLHLQLDYLTVLTYGTDLKYFCCQNVSEICRILCYPIVCVQDKNMLCMYTPSLRSINCKASAKRIGHHASLLSLHSVFPFLPVQSAVRVASTNTVSISSW